MAHLVPCNVEAARQAEIAAAVKAEAVEISGRFERMVAEKEVEIKSLREALACLKRPRVKREWRRRGEGVKQFQLRHERAIKRLNESKKEV